MNDGPFSRRGFTQMALLGAAGLWLPEVARGQEVPRLAARIVPSREGERLSLALFLTNQERQGLEVLARAIGLEGELLKLRRSHQLEFHAASIERELRSRAGPRLRRKVPLPTGQEVRYEDYHARWPEGLGGGGRARLVVRAVSRVDVRTRPPAERPALRALAAITARVTVDLPA